MISSIKKKQILFEGSEAKKPYQKRALKLLESSVLRERMMGFALLTTCFRLISPEIKDYIRRKWEQEANIKKVKKEFVGYCSKVFLHGY